MVGEAGLEPTTPGLEGRCSIQLSYSPASDIVPSTSTGAPGSIRPASRITPNAQSNAAAHASAARWAVAPQPSTNQVTPNPGVPSFSAPRSTPTVREASTGIPRTY